MTDARQQTRQAARQARIEKWRTHRLHQAFRRVTAIPEGRLLLYTLIYDNDPEDIPIADVETTQRNLGKRAVAVRLRERLVAQFGRGLLRTMEEEFHAVPDVLDEDDADAEDGSDG